MHENPNLETINALKKQLLDALYKNNYNLLSEEVLILSFKIDQLLVPLFREQLDHYYSLSVM